MKVYLLLAFVALVQCDVYLHSPRGSNNRLDGGNRERRNANRLFDSQNNDRGGYNVGDGMRYIEGSTLTVEWTNQHSCGEKNAHCEIVMQYMCDNLVRDGTGTSTIYVYKTAENQYQFGRHESVASYEACKKRERNKGLYTADQNMNGRDKAKNTRQNPKGTRRGLECPEERDYYPYWHPSSWKDIAIMTNDISRCEYYKTESQNVKAKNYCKTPGTYYGTIPNNQAACEEVNGWDGQTGEWTSEPAHGIPAPECLQTPKSRDNQNGNGENGFPLSYNWTLPGASGTQNCVFRMRYNISTIDYAPFDTDASNNEDEADEVDIGALVGIEDAQARGYVMENNPVVKPLRIANNAALSNKLKLELAINTAQVGRTFQDRSHAFKILPRPADIPASATIQNLNVKGKRGNIVQVYPAVEYDFTPNRAQMTAGDYVDIQWTGSDKNPRNNDGQGKKRQDRSNMILLESQNYPEGTSGTAVAEGLKFGQYGNSYPRHLNAAPLGGITLTERTKLALDGINQRTIRMGPIKLTKEGTYHYLSTRNNNFSNRSQKGKLIVAEDGQNAEGEIGNEGGDIIMPDKEQGLLVPAGHMTSNITVRISEWSIKHGNHHIKQHGGSIDDHGDKYSSKFIHVTPYGQLAEGRIVTVRMKVTESSAVIYHTTDFKVWTKVPDVSTRRGIATFTTARGGLFVARHRHPMTWIMAGVVIGIVAFIAIMTAVVLRARRRFR